MCRQRIETHELHKIVKLVDYGGRSILPLKQQLLAGAVYIT